MNMAIISRRMSNQGFVEVISWLGAVQAQDCPAAKGVVGQRMITASERVLDRAFGASKFLGIPVVLSP
jgi:hypothetical protein